MVLLLVLSLREPINFFDFEPSCFSAYLSNSYQQPILLVLVLVHHLPSCVSIFNCWIRICTCFYQPILLVLLLVHLLVPFSYFRCFSKQNSICLQLICICLCVIASIKPIILVLLLVHINTAKHYSAEQRDSLRIHRSKRHPCPKQ